MKMDIKITRRIPTVFILLAAITLPLVLNAYYMHIAILVVFYALAASSWNIFGGYLGQFYFAHSVFLGIGSYTSTLMFIRLGVSPWLGMLAGAGLAVVVALFIGLITFRAGLRDIYFALGTLALLEFTRAMTLNTRWTGGAQGLYISGGETGLINLQFTGKNGYYYVMLVLLLLVLMLTKKVGNSKLGYYLVAIRENEEAAQAVGVPMVRYKLIAISISALIGAVAGTLYAQYIGFLDPFTVFTFEMAVQILIIAIFGGAGTVYGPILGSMILVPLGEFTRSTLGQGIAGAHLIIYGLILMLSIIYLPNGIAGVLENLKVKLVAKWPNLGKILPDDSTQLDSIEIKPIIHTVSESLMGEVMLEVKDLSKQFGGLKAVDDVSFTVNRGETLGIIGPNGAGKTTVFSLITGFLKPDTGNVKFNGEDITGQPPHKICELGMSRTFQVVQPFLGLTTLETATISAYHSTTDDEEAQAIAYSVLKQVGLSEKALLATKNLSLPDLKRLELAKALCTGADMILLDEVMAGLTEVEVKEMVNMIKILRQNGITFVVIEHVMSAIMALSDRIIVLDNGLLISEGIPTDVANDPHVISAYLGDEEDVEFA